MNWTHGNYYFSSNRNIFLIYIYTLELKAIIFCFLPLVFFAIYFRMVLSLISITTIVESLPKEGSDLMWTDVNVIKFEKCVESYGKDFGVDRIQPGMFCASVRLFITSKMKK